MTSGFRSGTSRSGEATWPRSAEAARGQAEYIFDDSIATVHEDGSGAK
jgi:hypothetical protein